jgi:hypothetical protein
MNIELTNGLQGYFKNLGQVEDEIRKARESGINVIVVDPRLETIARNITGVDYGEPFLLAVEHEKEVQNKYPERTDDEFSQWLIIVGKMECLSENSRKILKKIEGKKRFNVIFIEEM